MNRTPTTRTTLRPAGLRSAPRFFLLAVAAITLGAGLLGPRSLQAQCGGSDDLPVASLPLTPGATAHSELGPDTFVVETPFPLCFPTAAPVAGVAQVGAGAGTETHVYSTPTPFLPGAGPSIDVVRGTSLESHGLSGTFLHAGATLCSPRATTAVGVTDVGLSLLTGSILDEFFFPGGVLPVAAASVGFCLPGGATWVHMVETTATLELVIGTTHDSFPLPGASVAPTMSIAAGDLILAVHYSASDVLVATIGDSTTLPLPGTYLSHTVTATGIDVTATGGTISIPLPSAASIIPFAPCLEPLDSAGPDATASAIAVNTGTCGGLSGVSSTWPAPAAFCGAPAGTALCVRPLISPARPKWAKVRARASTTVGGTDIDPPAGGWRRARIWTPIVAGPGAPGAPARVSAFAFTGNLAADFSWASADAWAVLVPGPPPCFLVRLAVNGGLRLVHQDGHSASFSAAAKDPIRVDGWDDADDVSFDLEFADTLLPIDPATHPDSHSAFHFSMGSTIPGLPLLWEGTVTATHDGNAPQLDVAFDSAAALALDDATVAAQIANLFTYDPAQGGYVVQGGAPVLTATADVPLGTSSFEIAYEAFIEGVSAESNYNGPPLTTAICGNGIVEDTEECDAPNGTSCSQSCTLTGLESRLILEVPDQIGPAPLPLILENPAPTSEFSVALCTGSNQFFGFTFQGTMTEFLNPELVLQQIDPVSGFFLHVIFDELPPYDGQMLPPLPGQPIAVIDALVNDPFDFQFCDDQILLAQPLPGQPSQQSLVWAENFVVNHGTELQLQGDGLITQVIVLGTGGVEFVRGDVNQDGSIDISDAIAGLQFLFPQTPTSGGLLCEAAFDVNDDNGLNIGDAVFLLGYLFQPAGSAIDIPQPFPLCAPDPTPGPTLCTQAVVCP